DPEPAVRRAAAEALGLIGPHALAAVPALLRALEGPDADRYVVSEALARVGPGALPRLLDSLADANPDVRSGAAQARGGGGRGPHPAVPRLVATLRARAPDVRYWAAEALGQVGRAAEPALRAALADAEAGIRVLAAMALWLIDPRPEPALPI